MKRTMKFGSTKIVRNIIQIIPIFIGMLSFSYFQKGKSKHCWYSCEYKLINIQGNFVIFFFFAYNLLVIFRGPHKKKICLVGS